MPRFAAHLGWQFTEVPFLERFEAAAAVGFGAVEYPSRDTRASLTWARPYGIRA